MAFAQDAGEGSIRGTVTNATGEYTLSNAYVTLVDEGRQVATDRSGRFHFSGVPAGEHTVRATYIGGEVSEARAIVEPGDMAVVEIRIHRSGGAMEEILVKGQAAGQASALNRRWLSEGLMDVLSSDSAGQFPDQNLAEALQRAAGVSVQRDQGEGRFVVIRGMDPRFNSTTINGLRVLGPEADSRAVNLDVISSDLIETVEISKSVTPDMDGDAVGGNIEVQTLTALDLPERFMKLTVGGSYNTTNEETSPDISATYADAFSLGGNTDNFGVAFSFSRFDRDTVTHGIESEVWPFVEAPGGGEFRSPEEGEQRDYVLTRLRTSLSLNFDYRPTDNTDLYLRTLYSEFDDSETKTENVYLFADGDVASLDENSGLFTGTEMERKNSDSRKIQEILSISTGGETELENWLLEYSVGYSVAGEESARDEIGGEFIAEDVDLGYNLDDREQPLYFGDERAMDPEEFAFNELAAEGFVNEERELALKLDFQRDVTFGEHPGYLKFGVKSRLREKENDIEAVLWEEFGGDFTAADFIDRDIDFPLRGDFGFSFDYPQIQEFVRTNRSDFTVNEEDSLLDSRTEDYLIDEDIHAAYVMASADIGELRLVGGLRAEYTDYSAVGTQLVIDEEVGEGDPVLQPFAAGKDYTNLFPSLNLRYVLSDRAQLRAAFSQSVARPGFEDQSPRQAFEISDEGDGEFERNAELGNPELEPFESNNLDFRWEFLPSGISVVSAGVFYKNIDKFFVTADIAGEPPFEDFDEVITVINGAEAELFGIELEYVRQFGDLPEPWNGLLLAANYTYTDSEATLVGRDSKVTLPGQSDHIGNLSFGFDNGTLSLRLSAAWRSEFFEEINDTEDPAFDRYQDDHLQLDLTGKYQVNDSLQVFFNAININDEPLFAYFDRPQFQSQYEEYGPTLEAGFSLEF
jgi:TonB-dependent receptor